jgi:glycine/D-amino acid oxidase-like deaminating enzyme
MAVIDPIFSYWERTTFIDDADVIIIGSGLVGLSAALHLKHKQPTLNITVLDRGLLPSGASTKNAGFACFGTVSEQLGNIKRSSETEMLYMIDYRYRGLQRLRANLGDENIRYEQHGGYELFSTNENEEANAAIEAIPYLNKLLSEVIGDTDIYAVADAKIAGFGFQGISRMIVNKCEGQIDTGHMMRTLLYKAYEAGVLVLNSCMVDRIETEHTHQSIYTNQGVFRAKKVIVANNAFASQLYPDLDIVPGRGQVLVTKPIANLKLKGTYHFNEGYYYFRNIDNRVLFGGGRNIDFKAEETADFGNTEEVKTQLAKYLHEMILPNQSVEIDYWWSGIMGFGEELSPIIKELQPNVFCAVRCNGMGIAMGSLVGEGVAELTLLSF